MFSVHHSNATMVSSKLKLLPAVGPSVIFNKDRVKRNVCNTDIYFVRFNIFYVKSRYKRCIVSYCYIM